jgi:hypothetical protein
MPADARDLVHFVASARKITNCSFELLVLDTLGRARQPQGGEAGMERKQGWRIGRN